MVPAGCPGSDAWAVMARSSVAEATGMDVAALKRALTSWELPGLTGVPGDAETPSWSRCAAARAAMTPW